MRTTRSTLALLLATALALTALSHLHSHSWLVLRLDTERTQYAPAADRPDAPVPVPTAAARVWIVIIDGLRSDAIDDMPALAELAERGVRRTLRAEFPSYTTASLTALATGVEPFYSGVRLNTGRVHPGYDTLIAVAARHGVPSVIAADWRTLARALDWQRGRSLPERTPQTVALRGPARELAWLHYDDVDHEGHAHGGRSPEYREAAARVDERLRPLFESVDLDDDAVVVLSDHGHLDGGGHGGVEAAARDGVFVAAGAGLVAGARLPPARLRDACATVAALAGAPPPRDSLGAPLIDVFAGGTALRARRLAPAYAQRAAADARLDAAVAIGKGDDGGAAATRLAALVAGDGAALVPALAELQARGDERAARVEVEQAERRARRLWWAALAVVALLAAWLVPRRWRPRARDALPLLVYGALFAAGYLALGYRLSWSLRRGEAHFVLETAIVAALAAAAALATARTRRLGGGDSVVAGRTAARAALVFPLAAVYLVVAAFAGVDLAWLAGPRISFALSLVATATSWLALALAADCACTLRAWKRLYFSGA